MYPPALDLGIARLPQRPSVGHPLRGTLWRVQQCRACFDGQPAQPGARTRPRARPPTTIARTRHARHGSGPSPPRRDASLARLGRKGTGWSQAGESPGQRPRNVLHGPVGPIRGAVERLFEPLCSVGRKQRWRPRQNANQGTHDVDRGDSDRDLPRIHQRLPARRHDFGSPKPLIRIGQSGVQRGPFLFAWRIAVTRSVGAAWALSRWERWPPESTTERLRAARGGAALPFWPFGIVRFPAVPSAFPVGSGWPA